MQMWMSPSRELIRNVTHPTTASKHPTRQSNTTILILFLQIQISLFCSLCGCPSYVLNLMSDIQAFNTSMGINIDISTLGYCCFVFCISRLYRVISLMTSALTLITLITAIVQDIWRRPLPDRLGPDHPLCVVSQSEKEMTGKLNLPSWPSHRVINWLNGGHARG